MATKAERNRHFAEKALDLLLAEVDDGLIGAIAFSVVYGPTEVVLYSVELGTNHVNRAIVVDDEIMEAAFDTGTVNATPGNL
jgi:hypothetical protein